MRDQWKFKATQTTRAVKWATEVLLADLKARRGRPLAEGPAAAPAGGSGYLTVQAKGCKVSNHFRCTGDPEGHQWRVDFGAGGPYFASRTDAEAQWIQSIELGEGRSRFLMPDPADPASLSALLAEGTDTYDFRLEGRDGVSLVRGFDTLTGRTVTIDGIPLLETEFGYEETRADGTLVQRARGNEYVHPEWRIFLSGPSEVDGGEGWRPLDMSPVLFVLPGEPGFFSDTPQFDCAAQMSRAPESLIPAKE
jgi:hypothetical protein